MYSTVAGWMLQLDGHMATLAEQCSTNLLLDMYGWIFTAGHLGIPLFLLCVSFFRSFLFPSPFLLARQDFVQSEASLAHSPCIRSGVRWVTTAIYQSESSRLRWSQTAVRACRLAACCIDLRYFSCPSLDLTLPPLLRRSTITNAHLLAGQQFFRTSCQSLLSLSFTTVHG